MSITEQDIIAGQQVYSRRMLLVYDWLVLGLSNQFIWKCPTRHLLRLYNDNITDNHLDVGVGTGFFLDRCRFPGESPRVALMDLNPNCLAAAAERIKRYAPQTFQRDILKPIELEADQGPFDSIGLNYVLHCLPGALGTKSAALDHLRQWLRPGGVMFGSTIVASGVPRGWTARRLMNFYNRRQIFSNDEDSLSALEHELNARFSDVSIETRGCVALFTARDSQNSTNGSPADSRQVH